MSASESWSTIHYDTFGKPSGLCYVEIWVFEIPVCH